ncbi:sulfate reduction electron transfer complex DsrMKJOP subunit DsrO [Pinisolibacter sp.]|uniref:sulfate reduction electron transfer complex DsrMKJOP subunit DsrO n=1 Tax=Pinisolibacter sp. TaxID=2172024 RepID=UPI002FDE8753
MTDRSQSCGGSCGCKPEAETVDESRRGFLAGAAMAGASVIAPGVTLFAYGTGEAQAAGADPKKRWGMLIDVSKCVDGCTGCVTACSEENGWKTTGHPATDPQWIRKVTLRDPKTGTTKSAPIMCQHCAEPPCADVCPTGASFKRADGIVLVDRHRCIGCRYCMMACPYKARSFVHEALEDQKPHAPRGMGTVEGCTLCVHRVDKGQAPACVEACAKSGGAIMFGDIADPNSEISKVIATYATMQIRGDLGVDPGVRYRNL